MRKHLTESLVSILKDKRSARLLEGDSCCYKVIQNISFINFYLMQNVSAKEFVETSVSFDVTVNCYDFQ